MQYITIVDHRSFLCFEYFRKATSTSALFIKHFVAVILIDTVEKLLIIILNVMPETVIY